MPAYANMLFFYTLLCSLPLSIFAEDIPLNFSTGLHGALIPRVFLQVWVGAVLIGSVGLSHALSESCVSDIANREIPFNKVLRTWTVDVLIGAVLALISYPLIVFCFTRESRGMAAKLVLVAFGPKILHLMLVAVIIFVYLFEGLRRFYSVLCEKIIGSKETVLTILALAADTIVVIGGVVIDLRRGAAK